MKPTFNRFQVVGICIFTLIVFPHGAGATPVACTSLELADLLEPKAAAQSEVSLTCNATLKPTDVIAKRVVILGSATSGLVLDCQGARLRNQLLILSRQTTVSGVSVWDRPEGITVRNCAIEGSIRVSGMAINGEAPLLRDSSRALGHTERAQNAAPRLILLENLSIRSLGGIPLYVSPGVTELTLRNSSIAGQTRSVGIYLDAESARNTISGNTIDAVLGREAIAVDGSAHNLIKDNIVRPRSTNAGGIYLYRNCGQGGTVRHQMPHSNSIVGNEFFVSRAIWVASRNGNRRYCHHDDGYPFGSSASNMDHAQNTVIFGNHFLAPESREILKIDDGPAFVRENRIIYPQFSTDPLPFSSFVTVATVISPVFTQNDVGVSKRTNVGLSCFDHERPPSLRVRKCGE